MRGINEYLQGRTKLVLTEVAEWQVRCGVSSDEYCLNHSGHSQVFTLLGLDFSDFLTDIVNNRHQVEDDGDAAGVHTGGDQVASVRQQGSYLSPQPRQPRLSLATLTAVTLPGLL